MREARRKQGGPPRAPRARVALAPHRMSLALSGQASCAGVDPRSGRRQLFRTMRPLPAANQGLLKVTNVIRPPLPRQPLCAHCRLKLAACSRSPARNDAAALERADAAVRPTRHRAQWFRPSSLLVHRPRRGLGAGPAEPARTVGPGQGRAGFATRPRLDPGGASILLWAARANPSANGPRRAEGAPQAIGAGAEGDQPLARVVLREARPRPPPFECARPHLQHASKLPVRKTRHLLPPRQRLIQAHNARHDATASLAASTTRSATDPVPGDNIGHGRRSEGRNGYRSCRSS